MENADSGITRSRGVELVTPIGFTFVLLRVAAVLASVAAGMSLLVIPGARGTFTEQTVVLLENAGATVAYSLVGIIVALLASGSFELARLHRVSGFYRGAIVGAMSLSLAIASPSLAMHLGPVAEMALSIATSAVILIAALGCLRAPHTRAAAITAATLGISNLARLTAWALALTATDGNPGRIVVARVLATLSAAALVAALGVATVWMGTRAKARGAALAAGSLVLAALVTYVALRETEPESMPFVVLRRALAGSEGAPAAYGISTLSVFAIPACVALAIAASSLRAHDAAGPVLALALASRGALDVPLGAMCVLCAAVWLPILAEDPRAMWQSLLAAKKERRPNGNVSTRPADPPKTDDAAKSASDEEGGT